MAGLEIEAAKAALRQVARARRASLDPEIRRTASAAMAGHFFAAVPLPAAGVVAGYWPVRDEVNCQPILLRLLESGHKVCLPAVDAADAPLSLRVWEPDAPLYPAGFGTLAPSELPPHAEPDLVLTPLLGFDGTGTRLGYGGGYYDRPLAARRRRPQLVGLAFAIQEFDAIPREPHDIPLDAVITERGARFFAGAA